ncbi:MAG: histidine phosphatase family protein [Bacillota bacterium]|nr:histidine phosphatase family protein [Bacillota bacterium]
MNLYLIRHGESVANVERRISGKTDVALTEKGCDQAREVAEKLANIDFSAVYSSNLQRAMNTAKEILKGRNQELKTFKELQERDFGDWEGLTFEQIQQQFPEDWDIFIKKGQNTDIPGGEGITVFYDRVKSAFENVIGRHDVNSDENICIVVHGCVLMALFSHFSHGDLSGYSKYYFENARVNLVHHTKDYSVIRRLNA